MLTGVDCIVCWTSSHGTVAEGTGERDRNRFSMASRQLDSHFADPVRSLCGMLYVVVMYYEVREFHFFLNGRPHNTGMSVVKGKCCLDRLQFRLARTAFFSQTSAGLRDRDLLPYSNRITASVAVLRRAPFSAWSVWLYIRFVEYSTSSGTSSSQLSRQLTRGATVRGVSVVVNSNASRILRSISLTFCCCCCC